MKFKEPELQAELQLIHPDVAETLRALDAWSSANALPEVVVTHVFRTPKFQEETYYKGFMNTGFSEEVSRKMARVKFSWHLVHCAVDIRNRQYIEAGKLTQVMKFLKDGRDRPMYEILSHDVSRGQHLHIGRCDFTWRKQHTPKEA